MSTRFASNEYDRLSRVIVKHPLDAFLSQADIDRQWRELNFTSAPNLERALDEYEGFVALLASRLAPGSVIHLATDWHEYAEQMLEVLRSEPLLTNTADGYAPRPAYRPLTKFEQRGLRLGHGVWDVVFRRG